MIYVARSLITTFLESFCCVMFIDVFFERREWFKRWKYYLLTILLWVSCFGIAYINIIYIRMLVAIMGFSIIAHIGFKGKLWHKVLFSVLYYGIMLIADCIVQLFVVTSRSIIMNSPDVKYTILMIFAKTLLLIITLLIKLLFRGKQGHSNISSDNILLYMIIPIMTIVLNLVFLTVEANTAMIVASIIILFLDVIFVMMLSVISDKEKRISEIRLSEENAKRSIEVFNALEQAYSEQRNSTHEFRHHMECIYGLLKNDEYKQAKEYVDRVNENYITVVNSYDTGNPIVNTVLSQKIQLAQRNGIYIIPIFNNLRHIKLEKDDIVIILSNLLDNAMEACDKLKNRKKEIKLSMEDDGVHTTIAVKNPIEEELNIKDGKLLTSKGDKLNHGIGISNVERVVRKYDGECMYRVKDGFFFYTINIENK